jgi:hypothetical protein
MRLWGQNGIIGQGFGIVLPKRMGDRLAKAPISQKERAGAAQK